MILVGNILSTHYKNILTEILCATVGPKHWGGSNEQQEKENKNFCPPLMLKFDWE